jgi:Flp pilus assembly protein TadG
MIRRHGSLNRKGQALVEFALVLPLVLLLVVGMLEFARAWNLHQTMTDAVREGARRAVLADGWPVDSVKAPMWRYLAQAGYEPSFATMEICTPPDTSCGATVTTDFKRSGWPVTIVLTLPYRFFILGGRGITMKSSFTVRNE